MNLSAIALSPGSKKSQARAAAFLTAQGPVSNERFQRSVFSYANGLVRLGLAPGDKVLLRMTNSVEFAASFLAVAWLGGIPVLQNSQFGQGELEYIVALTKPRGILFAASKPDPITDGLTVDAWRAAVTDSQLLRGDGAPVVDDPVSIPPVYEAQSDDPAFIVFTSGTTGRPKGIVHAHRWLDALGDSNRTRIPPQANDVALATGEWSFISALGHNVLFPLRNGVTGSIMDERASPERILATIARDRVTLLYSVATLYRRILSQLGIEERFDVSSLRGVNATGEPLEAAVREEWERRFKCPIWEHFGVSEAQMVLGHAPGVPERPGTVGVSWGARPEILNEDFTPQPPGTPGRLAFHGDYPGFFLEYLGDKQQTDATKRDGWFLTNDLATMDSDGYVSIFGRADDCFKSKGVLIVPRELEDALLQLGIVEEACVFGISDKEIGNQIGAAIVLRAGIASPPLGRQGVADALQGKIAHFKLPHEVFFFRELPKNANGKTQRSEVVRQVLASRA
jgi:acyl-coenzyme A synthetase/AMP-(fatty) acid ligase